jgi:cell division protein FtsX
MLGAIGICISYIAQNTALLHKRELEILNQVGASDNFITRQMQIIVAKISATATAIGFVTAVPVLLIINSVAHGARVGLMATMGLGNTGWIALTLLPIGIVIFAISITRKTTIRILKNS